MYAIVVRSLENTSTDDMNLHAGDQPLFLSFCEQSGKRTLVNDVLWFAPIWIMARVGRRLGDQPLSMAFEHNITGLEILA